MLVANNYRAYAKVADIKYNSITKVRMSESNFLFKEFKQIDRHHSLRVDQFESEYLAAKNL